MITLRLRRKLRLGKKEVKDKHKAVWEDRKVGRSDDYSRAGRKLRPGEKKGQRQT